jgi:hypothetical protein
MSAAPAEMSVRPVYVIAIGPISIISIRLVAMIEAIIRTISVISYGAIRIGINGAALYY